MTAPASNRSMLFVPGNRPERFDKAVATGADAVILDLEDAVPQAQRRAAAQAIDTWLQTRDAAGAVQIWVRVPEARQPAPWLDGILASGALTGCVLPKVETLADLAPWSVPVMAQIESAAGVLAMEALAGATSSLQSLCIGPEDLSVSLRVVPGEASLGHACARAVVAARAFGHAVYACPGSIGEFRDLARWRATLEAGRALGSDGMLCIHPAQVAVANDVFAPDGEQIAWAARVRQAWQQAQRDGLAAVSVDGRMIDPPVAQRALAVLEAARRFGLLTDL